MSPLLRKPVKGAAFILSYQPLPVTVRKSVIEAKEESDVCGRAVYYNFDVRGF